MSRAQKKTAAAAVENIEAIVQLEREFLEQRSVGERIGEAVAGFAGSLKSAALHVTWFAVWFIVNTGNVPGVPAFDPFPFILLSVMVSCEAVLLSTFVLIKQNRMSRRTEHRDHLNLQVGLLAERELTSLLRLQRLVCERLGIETEDEEVTELAEKTAIEAVARELERKLPS